MRVLVSRYGAYGDILNCSHLPLLLKDQGFDTVDFETNFKGYQLLLSNPFIDNILFFEPSQRPNINLNKHWEIISQGYDKFINLYQSLENNVLAMENQALYFMGDKPRRENGKGNYTDIITEWAGYPELVGKYRPEIYYSKEEKRIAKDWFKDDFNVMILLTGTGPHKTLFNAEKIIRHILDTYKNARVFTTGHKKASSPVKHERVKDLCGKVPFRQALLMLKYCNCAIGCESGLMVGAEMWQIPSIQLMTAASIENHCKYNSNSYAIQSPAYCSPCHKGPYRYIGCPKIDGYPLCVHFNLDEIYKRIREIHEIS